MRTIRFDRIFIALFFVWVAFLAISPAHDGDIWFNLKSGQVMLESGTVFTKDIFSFTRDGAEWTNRLWLFQVLLYVVFSMFSWTGIVLMKAVVIMLAFHFLLKPYYKNENIALIIIIAMMATLVLHFRLRIRPEMMSFLFLTFTFYCVEQFRLRREWRMLIPLPLLMVMWVNMHGLYILGFIIMAACMAEMIAGLLANNKERTKKRGDVRDLTNLVIIFTVSALGLLVNPFGLKGALVPFEQWQMITSSSFFLNIQELLPTAVYLARKGITFTTVITASLLLVSCILLVWQWVRTRKVPLFHMLVVCVFVYLGAKINRNLALFGLMALAVSASAAAQLVLTKKTRRVITIVCGIVLIVAMYSGMVWTFDTYKVRDLSDGLGATSYLRSPEHVVEFLDRHHITGRLYANRMLFGNYYLWKLGPAQKVFWDGRLEIYGEEFYKESILSVNEKDTFDRFLRRYDFDCLIFAYRTTYETDKNDGMYKRLVELNNSQKWKLVYIDSYYCAFLRTTTDNETLNAVPELQLPTTRREARRMMTSMRWLTPVSDVKGRIEEYYSLARIAHWFDCLVLVEYITDMCIAMAPDENYTLVLHGKKEAAAGNYEKAYELFKRGIADNSKLVLLLADVAFKLGRYEESIRYLEQFIRGNPYNSFLYLRLADNYYQLHDYDKAQEALEVVLAHDPENPAARKNYALIVTGMVGE